ncbi:SigE family RNA polymerase sigma factor [Kineosporia sp. A_224]|uniref:SigE family RNA polymerase sigma factor n=1 Tax=Kineosporia sp. A_224 TaxID=1962180 RepID=UPI000B4B59F1|nr:SigE family RNA polymerase sigma factor [Kineosporia sp. A_224]
MRRHDPPDGFAEFVTARSGALLRAAWALTGDRTSAEDLLQTALAEVWPKWARISAGQSPEAYVRRVLVSTFLSGRRRRWRGEVPSAQVPETAEDTDLAGRSAARDAVHRALLRLSPQQRSVVVLRYLEDLSIDETARTLGCSTATVKVQAGRALATLRSDPHLGPAPIGRWDV